MYPVIFSTFSWRFLFVVVSDKIFLSLSRILSKSFLFLFLSFELRNLNLVNSNRYSSSVISFSFKTADHQAQFQVIHYILLVQLVLLNFDHIQAFAVHCRLVVVDCTYLYPSVLVVAENLI